MERALLASDPFHETLLVLLKHRPWVVFLLPFWSLGGRAAFVGRVLTAARAFPLDEKLLPSRPGTVEALKRVKESGTTLVLVSATMEPLARKIADHLGVFAQVTDRAPGRADYFPPSGNEQGKWFLIVKALRLHQWAKNALLFVPLVLAHRVLDWDKWMIGVAAFFSFSFCASSVYVLNDLLDLDSDRRHPQKRNRPFAAGTLPVTLGLAVIPVLLGAAFCVSLSLVSKSFTIVLLAYLVTTTLYSSWFNRQPITDILVLAGLYALRLVAGGVAVRVVVSPWLLGFSMFFFLSLAYLKRYVELVNLRESGKIHRNRAGYEQGDLQMLLAHGAACGYLSVLVFALYINSADVTRLYPRPAVLWGICPLLLYWISRVWFIAHRGAMAYDPVVFALKDKVSLALVALSLTLLAVGSML